MKIRKGVQNVENGRKTAIIEFVFPEHIIYVFQGTVSKFDILIKYRKENTRIRTPRHIHWVVDVLMKMQGDRELTRSYLSALQSYWKMCEPLTNNDYDALKTLIEQEENSIDIGKYSRLDSFGEYNTEFLYVLMKLLAVQEKTNRPDAYMFGRIIENLLEDDIDIFKIVSAAGFKGRGK